MRLVVAAVSAFSGRQRTEGAGLVAGLTREWKVTRGVSLSGGALAAYNRFALGPQGVTAAQAFNTVEEAPEEAVDVTTRSTLTTLALELPLDVAVDLAAALRGRVGLAVGLTSALYVVQTFQDEGPTYSGQYVPNPAAGAPCSP